MRKRNIDIHLMLNEDEFHRLDALSHKSGLSFSVVLRRLINGAELRERPNMDFRSLARAIDRIGNNYNQIAHKVNASGIVSPDDLEKSRLLLVEIKTEIAGWKAKWL
ncbi:MAG: plasmid mobilization relaxosome protein MobC [Clostridiales bacterium]|nr:MAG: plasmid mobilization relaxosome protein MobC [Clostridiales bacterium]